MENLREKIESIIQNHVYCEDGKIIAKSHAASEILKIIEDNYVRKELIDEMINYVENAEIDRDAEFGSCRMVEQLIKDDVMPKLYYELKEILKSN